MENYHHVWLMKTLTTNQIDPTYYRSLTDRIDSGKNDNKKSKNSSQSTSSFDERDIQRAIKASVELDTSEDKALQQVLRQSLRDAHGTDNLTFINQQDEDPDVINQRLLDQAIKS